MEAQVTGIEFHPVDIQVDRDSDLPLHRQVYSGISALIRNGHLQPGVRIQQERELAATLGISLAPVRQAILSLVRDGYLERSRGRGTFVCERTVEERLSILSSFSSLLDATGRPWSMDLLFSGIVAADEPVSAALGGATRVLRIQRRAVLDGEPITLLDAYLDASRFGALATTRLDGSLYKRLAADFGATMSAARNQIGIALLTRDEAEAMGRRARAPFLEVVSVTSDQHGTPTEYSRVLYHPARFRFQIDSRHHDDGMLRLLAAHPN